ncbi:TetR/AcrR family transcriptional regulator [Cellulomonas denverensis]|uniref:TetR/AcrR family transcriptional regulator n=1 Tax=Cellulomonas denverensis TaxID=264297 RepID=A0A7X6QZD7_9CELL|nr:TetR/AcrR family transcriptional regulator [Cellulomonas denverensis]NKY23078.1 TetR/AcrR family transcriptional regulator [Cellulomonas denverensis]GIG23841.1 TetR family transcriptional regulator [Cellulomonas denverensis]
MRADAARNRQAVLDAARGLFTRDGLDTSMEAVARAAGVGVGTVYRHFPDRGALVRAVIADRIARVGELVAQARARMDDDPAAAWWDLFDGIVDSGLPLLVPLLVPRSADEEVFPDELLAARAATAAAAEQVLRAAQEHGVVRPDLGAAEIMLLLAGALRRMPGLPPAIEDILLARRLPLVRAALRPDGTTLPGDRLPLPMVLDALGRP